MLTELTVPVNLFTTMFVSHPPAPDNLPIFFCIFQSEYLTIQNEKSGLEKQLEKIGGSQLQNESEMDRLLKENNQLKQEIEYLKVYYQYQKLIFQNC